MARQITKKQESFAKEFIDTGNRTQAALKVYDTKSYMTAANIGSENLNKPKVMEYIQEKAPAAASKIFQLSQKAKNEGVALGASKDILDRAGFKPIEKSQSINVNVNAEIDNSKYKDLKAKFLKELDELEANE